MTSFGVAPALVMYEWVLHDLDAGDGPAHSCIAAAPAGLRFNANLGVIDKRSFRDCQAPPRLR